MASNQATSNKFFPRGISWLTIVLAILSVVSFVVISSSDRQYGLSMEMIGGQTQSVGTSAIVPPNSENNEPMMDKRVTGAPTTSNLNGTYPDPISPDVPVSDTREFLKVYYNAIMRTQDVQGLTRRVETTVRGYQGRVDQISESPQFGFVSFVVPQSKYDAFRAELESLISSRFLTTNISAQNLLPEKQSIEEQQKQADASLSDFQTARQNIVDTHTNMVQSIQSKIDAAAKQLSFLRSQDQTPEISTQIQNVSNNLSSLKQQLVKENSSYSTKLSNADRNIKNAQDRQKAVQTQDQALLDNVATVRGAVSIQWISLWDITRLYLPGYWISFIFTALAVLSFLFDRWRFGKR